MWIFLSHCLKTENALYKSKPQRAQCKFGLTAEIKEKIFKNLTAMIFLKCNNASCNNTERKKTGKDKLAVTASKLQNCGSIKGTLSREPA